MRPEICPWCSNYIIRSADRVSEIDGKKYHKLCAEAYKRWRRNHKEELSK